MTAALPSSVHAPDIPWTLPAAFPPAESVISIGLPDESCTFHTPSKGLAATLAKPIIARATVAATVPAAFARNFMTVPLLAIELHTPANTRFYAPRSSQRPPGRRP